jgi:hypothetical protein
MQNERPEVFERYNIGKALENDPHFAGAASKKFGGQYPTFFSMKNALVNAHRLASLVN